MEHHFRFKIYLKQKTLKSTPKSFTNFIS